MKILLTSDLHGRLDAFLWFSSALKKDYDLGVIAGDLLDDHTPNEELGRFLDYDRNMSLPALPASVSPADRLAHGRQESMNRALLSKEREIKDVLKSAGKPVLVVPGNHDSTALSTDGTFINVHMRRIEIGGQPFVGYGCISRVLGPDLQMAFLNELEEHIDERTILVTHIPPYGTLDRKSVKRSAGMQSFGSRILADTVSRRNPRFHFFGDAHDSVGTSGNSINASYVLVSCFCGVDTDSGEVWTEKRK